MSVLDRAKPQNPTLTRIFNKESKPTTKERLGIALAIAEMFIGSHRLKRGRRPNPGSLDIIKDAIVHCYGQRKYRNTLTKFSADDECSKALIRAIDIRAENSPLYPEGKNNQYTDKNGRYLMKNETTDYGSEQESSASYSVEVMKGSIKGNKTITRKFNIEKRGHCGKCWLCGENVYYYKVTTFEPYYNDEIVWPDDINPTDTDDQYIGLETSCGQCEHIGAILASLAQGMFANSLRDNMVYNYGPSHVHCNQKKSDTVTMQFNIETLKWEIDEINIREIVNRITLEQVHASEYDEEFIKKILPKLKEDENREKMISRIREVTTIWCEKANEELHQYGRKRSEIIFSMAILIFATMKRIVTKIKGSAKVFDAIDEEATIFGGRHSNELGSALTRYSTVFKFPEKIGKKDPTSKKEPEKSLLLRRSNKLLEKTETLEKQIEEESEESLLLRRSNELLEKTEILDSNFDETLEKQIEEESEKLLEELEKFPYFEEILTNLIRSIVNYYGDEFYRQMVSPIVEYLKENGQTELSNILEKQTNEHLSGEHGGGKKKLTKKRKTIKKHKNNRRKTRKHKKH